MSSCVPVPPTAVEACANCGKEGTDAAKLKNCTACFLVKYCSVECQKIHRKQHKKACKKRAAELKDEELYGQGHERAEADFCPICLLAMPFPVHDHATFRSCCMKSVCDGCNLGAKRRGLSDICPFCRTPPPKNDDEVLEMVQKRVTARDPEAICRLGDAYFNKLHGLEKDTSRAFELWSEAAELGSSTALHKMGYAYYQGDEGLEQDVARGTRYWELGAMQGSAESRHYVGLFEIMDNKNYDRALRHFLISAKMGFKDSLDAIKQMFADGLATKAQYAETLKGYQDALEDTKSPQRDEAAKLTRRSS